MSRRRSGILVIACLAAAVTSQALAGLNRWTRSAPEGGNVRSIAVDRTNERVMYAAVNGVVYKSEDAGAHWLGANDGMTAWVFSVVISPSDSAVLYAAGLTAGSVKLFKSTDAAQHWAGIPGPPQNQSGARLAVTGNALLIASDTNVHRTTDDGRSWQRTFDGAPNCCIKRLVNHPSDGSLFLFHRLVYRSTDGGVRWNALPAAPSNPVTGALDSDGTIYVETANVMTRVMHRSRDNGQTFSEVVRVDGSVRSIDAVSGRLFISRGFDPEELRDLPFSKNKLLEYDGTGLNEQRGFAGTAVTVVMPAGASRIIAATDGAGIMARTEAAPEWTAINRGLPGPPATDIAISPRAASGVYAATAAGLVKSDDSGATWRTIGDAGWQEISVSPVNPDVAYIATGDGVQKTIDGGASFTVVLPTVAASVAVAPSNADTVYAALIDGMAKSTDAGQSWTGINTGLIGGSSVGPAVVVDPRDAATVYLATDEALYKTTTGGASWSQILTSRRSGGYFLDFWGNAVVIDPSDSETLYVLRNHKGVRVSQDAGATWRDASFPLDARTLLFDPAAPNVVYATDTNGSLFRSGDRGLTFSPFAEGLEGVSVDDLTIDASGSFLYAATSQGIYSLQRVDSKPSKRGRAVRP